MPTLIDIANSIVWESSTSTTSTSESSTSTSESGGNVQSSGEGSTETPSALQAFFNSISEGLEGISLAQVGAQLGTAAQDVAGDAILAFLGVESREQLTYNVIKGGTYLVLVIVAVLLLVAAAKGVIEQ